MAGIQSSKIKTLPNWWKKWDDILKFLKYLVDWIWGFEISWYSRCKILAIRSICWMISWTSLSSFVDSTDNEMAEKFVSKTWHSVSKTFIWTNLNSFKFDKKDLLPKACQSSRLWEWDELFLMDHVANLWWLSKWRQCTTTSFQQARVGRKAEASFGWTSRKMYASFEVKRLSIQMRVALCCEVNWHLRERTSFWVGRRITHLLPALFGSQMLGRQECLRPTHSKIDRLWNLIVIQRFGIRSPIFHIWLDLMNPEEKK